ncbi:ATP-binding cassette subfamily B multidrug efflux pump [Breznakia sp. PF5-3]|uniref:ABC transporter ATP-binding protein n=1 Tax=unclassified Breznakia TaxID=2623764 RepID=UPI002407217F|nr:MULTISPECIES: ABC transporter ATP-binding protein [unclassified Breznakia]MDF9823675.1 ATP-binding cassette subfamily B multidrug efflux pump [Breznakia sp. PM6-1]MDF9834473.1 ATP-binding cassette subfamily B multidrug efflux pump [Breznakia sp. PF5-3]MDF9838480.1 ATP-binding cassette subfamily B multidrug efflux pump [Breznakia sp. PFB2-8]MDF9859133.1 ATP-binding cassette subfamily B multidrug efflux pump [Breznakia sp. PH5-24]
MNNYDKETFTAKEQLSVLLRLLRYLKPYKGLVFLAFVTVIFATVFSLLGPMVIKDIVDTAFVDDMVKMDIVYQKIALYAGVILAFALFRYLQTYQFNNIGFKVSQNMRVELYKKLQNMGMRYFDQTPAGSIVSRVTNDTEAIQDMLNNVLAVIVSSIILIIGIMIAMLLLDVTMALICFLFLPVAIFVIYLYQKYSTKFYLIARDRLSQLNTRLAESISGMNIIQLFNQQKRISDEFEETNKEYYDASMKNVRLDGILLAPTIQLLTALALAILFSYTGLNSLYGSVSVGVVVAFIEYVYRYFDPMFQIMERLSIYQQAIVSAYRVFKILDHEELTPQQNENASGSIKEAKIEFKNVSFSYDGEKEVLTNISFEVNPGETIALVGHTGSGKSSIINVMMRFYEFYQGEILIDGKSIKDYPIEELRSKMGLVLQDPFMFYGTINDNIRLQNKNISDHDIRKACEFVQADTFINQLSDGYEHRVIERGSSFSTGQKQLLAFARTIVTNPKILILDEATANIDTETEVLIQEGLERIRRGRTSIAIAHRLSTIKDANKILVLDKGKIVEQGTHDELLSQKGTYYMMYQLQKSEENDNL